MAEDLVRKDLIIEHLDSNELNNTIYNLSAMDKRLNSKKRVIDRMAKPPFYLIPAYKNGIYKYLFLCNYGILFSDSIKSFNSAEDYINSVVELYNSKAFTEFESVKEHYNTTGNKPYNLPLQYKLQKLLYDNFKEDDEVIRHKLSNYLSINYIATDNKPQCIIYSNRDIKQIKLNEFYLIE